MPEAPPWPQKEKKTLEQEERREQGVWVVISPSPLLPRAGNNRRVVLSSHHRGDTPSWSNPSLRGDRVRVSLVLCSYMVGYWLLLALFVALASW